MNCRCDVVNLCHAAVPTGLILCGGDELILTTVFESRLIRAAGPQKRLALPFLTQNRHHHLRIDYNGHRY